MNIVSPSNRPPDLADLPLEGLLHAAREAVLVLDPQRRVLALNPAAERLFGCSADQLRGRSLEHLPAALPVPAPRVVPGRTQRRRLALESGHSRQALRRLSASVVEAREEERRRIARELHDELGQRLTALKMDLSGLAAERGGADARLAGMLAMLDETVASVRRIAADLRPLMLDDLGLDAAIEWLASEASRRLGIEVRVALADIDAAMDERVAIALFRMVQEALTNVGRHARATEVRIELRRQDGQLVLSVRDNGIGIPERALHREGSFGLLGMRERARMLGGGFEFASPPGGGGLVTVRLPLSPPAASTAPSSLQEQP